MLNFKKPVFWLIVLAIVACAVAAVCFLANPKNEPDLSFLNYNNLVSLAAQTDSLPAHIATSTGTTDSIVSGSDLAAFLDKTSWAAQRGVFRSVQRDTNKNAAASVQITFDEDVFLRIFDTDTVYIYSKTQGQGRYYRAQDGDYEKIIALVGRYSEGNTTALPFLTLDDVIILSGKGEDLTWADFAGYSFIETGSGLYIQVYEIDARFSLWIGGLPDDKPMYVRLVSKTDLDDYIDIRSDDVGEFINEHQPVYRYSFTIYINMLSSYFPAGTTGYLYQMGNNSFDIIDEASREIYTSVPYESWSWSQLSRDDWKALFVVGSAPDISGIDQLLMFKLSDKYYFFNMDGSLWLGDYHGQKNGMWSVYELTPDVTNGIPAATSIPRIAPATKNLLEQYPGYITVDAATDDYGHQLLLTTEAALKDLSLFSLVWDQATQSLAASTDHPLYNAAELAPDKPLLVSVSFPGVLPTVGLAYTDESGAKKYYHIVMSGKDGSVMLVEAPAET